MNNEEAFVNFEEGLTRHYIKLMAPTPDMLSEWTALPLVQRFYYITLFVTTIENKLLDDNVMGDKLRFAFGLFFSDWGAQCIYAIEHKDSAIEWCERHAASLELQLQPASGPH